MSNPCVVEVVGTEDTIIVLFQDDYASTFRSYPKEEFFYLFPTVPILLDHVSNWKDADSTFYVDDDENIILNTVSSLVVKGLTGNGVIDFTKYR